LSLDARSNKSNVDTKNGEGAEREKNREDARTSRTTSDWQTQ